MKTRIRRGLGLNLVVLVLFSLPHSSIAQGGGGFELTEGVVATGGATSSAGDTILDSTIGQPAAGDALREGLFAITSGFWNFTPLNPTAASATISGRVRTADGIGISGAVLYLQTQAGEIYVSRSASLGYYMFEGIEVGQSVFITVESKRFTFQSRSVMLSDSVADLDFIPLP